VNSTNTPSTILVTGATGYVGGRLAPRLLELGYRVRVLVRDPQRLQGRAWSEQVQVVRGDILKPESLSTALQGCQAAYYMVHSLGGGEQFHARDVEAARNFGKAAKEAGVARIIYLGGLGDADAELSTHLRSRQQTGAALREAGVPVTEFRAAVIVGSGSLSFEMVRYLTERIPLMITPLWVQTRIQPIAIRDVISYLTTALEQPASAGQIIEIGGADVLTYGEMMLGYARARGLKRWLLRVPVLTPRLSSYWVHWMTPIPAGIARPLIEGLRNEVIVHDPRARQIFPDIQPVNYQSAVERSLAHLEAGAVETAWSDALTTSQGDRTPVNLTTEQGIVIERREVDVQATPAQVFTVFSGLGGERGWLVLNIAWQLRGMLDRLVGGVGMRRGRRHPDELRVGDAVDFWRVEAIEPGSLLRLRAEMKVPGKAWLQLEATPLEEGRTRLVQKAFFAPKGLSGWLYWYLLYPVHALIFRGMVQRIGQRAAELAQAADRATKLQPQAR
jgi:uncharacterized protein YbjT (DUF2867 family)